MFVTLPKLNAVNVFKMTAIRADAVAGVEPCMVKHNGKTYEGSKVYTKSGGHFKVFASPTEIAMKTVFAIKSGEVVSAAPLLLANPTKAPVALPTKPQIGYAEYKAQKALGSGK